MEVVSGASASASRPAPAVGTRVKRSGDWKWGDQDGGAGKLGSVTDSAPKPGWVRVQWDAGGQNSYRWGTEGCYDVEVVSGGSTGPRPLLPIGTRVRRGPNWKWGDQDGGAGCLGTVVADAGDAWLRVKWDAGATNAYRWGAENSYDLEAVMPSGPLPPLPGQRGPIADGHISYVVRSGEVFNFDISDAACTPFGFRHRQRVKTPKGPSWVIGVKDGELWFHVDSDTGASFWGGDRAPQLREKGFVVIEDAPGSSGAAVSSPPSSGAVTYPLRSQIGSISAGHISYKCMSGETKSFDLSDPVCEAFGYHHGDRVKTTDGPATVIGVADGQLWFHCDSDSGAAFWGSLQNPAAFAAKGFSMIQKSPRPLPAQMGPAAEGVMLYRTRSGEVTEFSITDASCLPFGFRSGQRVMTPKGASVAVGVQDGDMWFHIDGETGASRWKGAAAAFFRERFSAIA